MIKKETYKPTEGSDDLRDVFAKKIGPVYDHIIYLEEDSKTGEKIYYTDDVTIFVGNSYLSLVGSSHEERQKVRETLEQRLSIKLKIFESQTEENISK